MLQIKDFRIKKKDREIGKKQYMYYRIEGDGYINNGTTSQEERYSTKTTPKEERWYNVSSFMKTGLKDRPDDIFHKWLAENKKIYAINKHRDLFRPKDLPINKFEEYLVEYAEEKLGKKSNNPLKLREYQKDGAQFLIDFIKGSENKGLLEALPGYGKTFVLYFALLEAKTIKNIAIVTSLKLVRRAFVKEFVEQNLAAKGCALRYKDDTNKIIELGDWNTAIYKFTSAPKFTNNIFKEYINNPNCLWVHDEAHLGGSSKKSEEFYKNKKVLFITGTGNKLFDKVTSHYFFGISAMAQAIKDDPTLKTKFPIPQIEVVEKFQHLDFGRLKLADSAILEELINDIVAKSIDDPKLIKNGLVKVGGRYSESAHRLYEVARLTHPEISWYLAADGKNSNSADEEGTQLEGQKAIGRFDHDCEYEPKKTHILITQFQGKESYSYYDLYNVFYLSESSSPESFIQTFGRLDRPKKNSGADTGVFYMYSSFVHFCEVMQDEYKRECNRMGKVFDQDDFNDFIRLYNITADITLLPDKLDAEYVLNLLSVHSELTRGCSNEDWILLRKYFSEIKEKGNSGLFDNLKKVEKPNKKKGSFPVSSSIEDEDTITKKEKAKITRDLKEKIELIFNRISFYCRYLEYYKQNPNKIQKKNEFIKKVKNYVYPENIKQLRNLPIYNFRSLVYNFKDNNTIKELFNNLSDTFLENLLVKVIMNRNTPLEELSYGLYSPYSKSKVDDGKIKSEVFKNKFLPRISTPKNGKILLIRTGINTVLILKEQGFSNLTYYTDIAAEKFECDFYDIDCKYVKQVNQKENWVETLKEIAMKYDLIIMNPPYAIGGKIVKAAITHLKDTGEVVNLMPLNQYKNNLFKHIKDFQLVDPKAFKDAIITPNLNICVLKKNEINVYTWDQLLLTSFDQNYIEFYKWNIAHNKGLSMKQNNYKAHTTFDIDTDFIETSFCYFSGAGFSPNGCGYKFNVLKSGYEKDWMGHLGQIKLPSKKAKDMFCKYWYNGRKDESLASKVILGIHTGEASATWYMSIPQIDWEKISTTPLWKAGQYDEAVLDVMGLKWDANKEKILIK